MGRQQQPPGAPTRALRQLLCATARPAAARQPAAGCAEEAGLEYTLGPAGRLDAPWAAAGPAAAAAAAAAATERRLAEASATRGGILGETARVKPRARACPRLLLCSRSQCAPCVARTHTTHHTKRPHCRPLPVVQLARLPSVRDSVDSVSVDGEIDVNGLLQEQAAGMEVRTSGTAEDALPRLALSLRLDPLSARPMLTWLYGEHAGVAVGDLLLSVNGQRPATVEAAETLLLKASCSGMPIDLEVCAAPRGTEAEAQRGPDPSLASLEEDSTSSDIFSTSLCEHSYNSSSASPDRNSPWLRSRRRSSIGLGELTAGYL